MKTLEWGGLMWPSGWGRGAINLSNSGGVGQGAAVFAAVVAGAGRIEGEGQGPACLGLVGLVGFVEFGEALVDLDLLVAHFVQDGAEGVDAKFNAVECF